MLNTRLKHNKTNEIQKMLQRIKHIIKTKWHEAELKHSKHR